MLTFRPEQFIDVLGGQTQPISFMGDGVSWVFRHQLCGAAKQLRLASELVGHRVATCLGVPVPELRIAHNVEPFQPRGSLMEVAAGIGTATMWLAEALLPDVENRPLASVLGEGALPTGNGSCALQTRG